ncbi:glycosyltransferase family 4 protein [Planococcus sp. SSTMD024]|uniref:glycosyltransferase family 4 protein n=1 Tax=Planococcus sp. SSTMD024 TaxID=3242163 RepID=UPI00351E1B84
MKKRVLLLGNHGFVIYNFRKELIQRLLKEGYEVYISLPYDEKVDLMVSWGCKFIETKVDRRGTNPITDSKLLGHYLKMLKKVKPDIVFTYTIKPNLYGGIACGILNIPYISNITGLGSGFNGKKSLKMFLSSLYKMGLKKSHCVFFQNTEDLKKLSDLKIVKGNYDLLPGSGVNLTDFKFEKKLNTEKVNFLFIGRIMKDKGIDQYLEAARLTKQKYPETQFNVIGFIENSQSYYAGLIEKYVDDKSINFFGYQTNVIPFIQDSDCLIQPSHGGEGLSNVLLETGAIGRSLIASNIAGCREAIDEGINGYTFEKKNTKDLVEKIEKFVKLTFDERVRMGINSRYKIEKEFDRNIVINSYFEKLEEVFSSEYKL